MSAEDVGGTSEDALLGGRVRLRQPREGYRAAIDPVFLAAAVPAKGGDSVLDIGCGAGAALACLAARLPEVRITGIEVQRELVRLANENVELNGLAGRVAILHGDLLRPPPRLAPGTFEHVMANPPHHERGAVTPPPYAARAGAHVEGEADLAGWVRFAAAMVRPGGSVTFVHRADRIDALLAQLAPRFGAITIFPLWPAQGKAARRVLVAARKDSRAPARLLPGMVLHHADGRYTPDADAVLRHASYLDLETATD